jgi:hypothetical protein
LIWFHSFLRSKYINPAQAMSIKFVPIEWRPPWLKVKSHFCLNIRHRIICVSYSWIMSY